MRPDRLPRPPGHLTRQAKAWWRSCVGRYELEDHHLLLLQAAAETWDRIQEARDIVDREGAIVQDRYGKPKAHPAVGVERDARVVFARLLRELDLDAEALPDPRPPRPLSRRSGRP